MTISNMQASSNSVHASSSHVHPLPIHAPSPWKPWNCFATVLDWIDDNVEPMVPNVANPPYWRVGGAYTQHLIACHREARWSYDWYRYDLERKAEPSSNIAPPWPPFKALPSRLFEREDPPKADVTALAPIVEEGTPSAEDEASPDIPVKAVNQSPVSSIDSERIDARAMPGLGGASVGSSQLEPQLAWEVASVATRSSPRGDDTRSTITLDIRPCGGSETVPRAAVTTSSSGRSTLGDDEERRRTMDGPVGYLEMG
ncbi:hypothetical protein C8Q73DRAFT_533683 [Cubamyces lactineus]|nr:hypothetical protein C8Q73DRAFT_533683 [Cubamyces lactineus]